MPRIAGRIYCSPAVELPGCASRVHPLVMRTGSPSAGIFKIRGTAGKRITGLARTNILYFTVPIVHIKRIISYHFAAGGGNNTVSGGVVNNVI